MKFGAFSERIFRSNNFVNKLAGLRAAMNVQDRTVYTPHAYEILEDFIQNRFIASSNPDITEPTDPNFSGWFLSAALQALTDGNFGLANVLLGAVQYGIGESGEFIRGVSFLSNHLATVGVYDRRARRGFQELDSKPAYLVEYIDDAGGTNLITSNPGAELGNLTGWTVVSGTWSADSSAPIAGVYSFRVTNPSGILKSDKYAITAGNLYKFSVVCTATNNGSAYAYAKWYDAGSVLLKTDTIFNTATADTSEHSASFVAPTGATQVEFWIWTGSVTLATYTYFDTISIELVGEYAAIRLDDNGVYAVDEAGEVNVLGFPQSDLQFADQMITNVTVVDTVDSSYKWGHYIGPTSANSADGQEYLFQFTLAAGTYTLYTYGNANLNCGKVDYYRNDETTPFSTGQDWYLASAGAPAEKSISGVVIEVGGRQTIKVKVNGKTGATYYRWLPTALWFVPATYTPKAGAPEPVPTVDYFLLLEDGSSFLLLEDGSSKIILEA